MFQFKTIRYLTFFIFAIRLPKSNMRLSTADLEGYGDHILSNFKVVLVNLVIKVLLGHHRVSLVF